MKALFNIKEVAEHFGVTKKTVYEWVVVGRLPKPINRHGSPRWDTTEMMETFRNYVKPAKPRDTEGENCHA